MNITDLIVEFIKEGNVVEFPGMGTLTSSTVSAYHDETTGTYYPARRTVVMNNTQNGNQAIIRKIAESECVTVDIAEMMWKNYVGALNDKLQRDPGGHEFTGLGHMRRAGGKVVFVANEGLDLDADKRREQPLENVATYTPKNVEDPFAAFEKAEPEPTATPAPKPVTEPTPKPEPEPIPEPKPTPEQEVAPTPAPEVKEAEEPAPKPEIESVGTVAAAAAASAPSSSTADHLSEVKKMLDEIPSSPKSAKEARRAEKAAAKAEKEARKAAEEAEKEAAKKAAQLAKEKEAAAKEAEKARRQREKEAAKPVATPTDGEEKKKKKHGWLWIVLLLLLILIGCGAYYFLKGGNRGISSESYAKEVEWSRYDPADLLPMPAIDTNMLNLLEFDEDWIANTANDVHMYMSEYVYNFLLARHYRNAFAPMMNSIDQYASGRLHELMVPGFSHKRFHPYNDFWMERNLNNYKHWGARYYQYQVQGELLDIELLENMLDDLVVRMGLKADGFGAAGMGGTTNKSQYKSLVERPFEETVPDAPTFRNSKQGYDIIAGFATDKRNANKLANQLKKLGCDAYIISKSGGYYISMGSAPTLTAAQAMEDHIKGWYQGPVSIKNFNE